MKKVKPFHFKTIVIFLFSITLVSHVVSQDIQKLYKQTKTGPDSAQVDAMLELAWYYVKSQTDSSLIFANQALKKAVRSNYKIGEMRAHGNLGVTYAMAGDYKQSIEHNIKTYEIAVSLKRVQSYPKALLNIANGYYQMLDYDKALHFYNRSIEESRKQNDYKFKSETSALNQIAEVYFKLKKYDLSDKYSNEALALCIAYKDTLRWCYNLNSRGELEALKGNYQKSSEYLLQSLSMRTTNDEYGKIVCYERLAKNYLELKHYELAAMYIDKAEELIMKNGNLDEKGKITFLRSTLYERTNRYKDALIFHKLYLALKDSINSIEKNKYISTLQVKFDTKQKEHELEKAKIQIDTERITKRVIMAVSVVLLFLIAFAVANVRKRNKILAIENANIKEKIQLEQEKRKTLEEKAALENERKKYEEQRDALEKERLLQQLERAEIERQHIALELDEKHRSLVTSSMQQEQHKEFLSGLAAGLQQLKSISGEKELAQSIDQISGLIKGKINQADDWDKIKLYFEKVHPEFFERLKNAHPDLSITELKLCAYTKMNLNGKEISRLLNINPTSVQVSRYRLKRKMGIPQEVNFSDYILEKC